jgi:hypothetical protein
LRGKLSKIILFDTPLPVCHSGGSWLTTTTNPNDERVVNQYLQCYWLGSERRPDAFNMTKRGEVSKIKSIESCKMRHSKIDLLTGRNMHKDTKKIFKSRMIFYLFGLLLSIVGHWIFSGNSHTPPLSIMMLTLFIILGTIWLMIDLVKIRRLQVASVHMIGLMIYVGIISLML